MRRTLTRLLLLSLLTLAAGPATAEDGRVILGWGRLFNNDAIGDTRDRWRSGSYAVSIVTGREWAGRLPQRPGEILEFRLRSEVIAPANLAAPAAGDRRYAGIISAGVHTHFTWGTIETSAGLDLVAMGPMTGVGRLQTSIHEKLGLDAPALGNQIPDKVMPTFTAELARSFRLGGAVTLRPFAELSAGAESFARLGGDVQFGGFGDGGLMLRDVVTGQRYAATAISGTGFSFNFGGDIAKVFSSSYLPEDDGYELTSERLRLRAGLAWQGERSDLFYGVTWLGREFEAQPEGQVVGSLRLGLRF